MAGTKSAYEPEPQPGGRPPAPGRLAIVQAFLNTHFDATSRGEETLTSPQALDEWLRRRGLSDVRHAADADDLRRALAVREGIRALAFANNDQTPDDDAVSAMLEASRGARTAIRIHRDGPEFRPCGTGVEGAIGVIVAAVAAAMLDGSWPRLKACPGRHCGWVFFDQSRNMSARWCAMTVCGDREKARAYYRRKAGGG